MSSTRSFGVLLGDAASCQDVLTLEEQHNKRSSFVALEELVAALSIRALQGERIARFSHDNDRDRVVIEGTTAAQRNLIEDMFSLDKQQQAGAWFLPEKSYVGSATVNMAARLLGKNPNRPTADDTSMSVSLADADSFFVWALLEPFIGAVILPVQLRDIGILDGMPRDAQDAYWTRVDDTYADLGLEVDDLLQPMRIGGGWSRLKADAKLKTKRRFITVLAERVTAHTVARYRGRLVRAIVRKYYEKAKNGLVLHRRVLTQDHRKTLAAFYGGSWLRFLEYVGEGVHPNDSLQSTLPAPRLYTGAAPAIHEVSAATGVPANEVEKILAVFGGGSGRDTPLERRMSALRRYWAEFDRLHSIQKSGERSLWGLIEERDVSIDRQPGGMHSNLFAELVDPDVRSEIRELWGGVVLPGWEDRIVTEPFPQRLATEAFGPALSLWHGIALTAWFICEGPYSRTDLPGLETHHRHELQKLTALGCPISPALFGALREAEAALGPEEPIILSSSQREVIPGLTLTVRTTSGSRRAGFEILRDIVTRHRRAWASDHLDKYLRTRWETELRSLARTYSRRTASRGKPPTANQFAPFALELANQWFGGNIGAVYAAIGEKSPFSPERAPVLLYDPLRIAREVFRLIGGRLKQPAADGAPPTYNERQWNLQRLAEESLGYVQLQEALGRPPSLDDFGRGGFERRWPGAAEEGWARYTRAIQRALKSPKPSDSREATTMPPTDTKDRTTSRPDLEGSRNEEAEIQSMISQSPKTSWFQRLLGR